MDFFEYFHKDTARTFPVPTDAHALKVLQGLSIFKTFDNQEIDDEDENVGVIMHNIRDIINTGILSDVIKAHIFYGKNKDYESEIEKFTEDMPNAGEWAVGSEAVSVVHGLLGMVSENAELCKAVVQGMANNQKFDVVNIKEEIGDIIVYAAVIGNALGFTLEDAMKTNIAKRAKRFPNGFTEFDAVNRDTVAERVILEEKH